MLAGRHLSEKDEETGVIGISPLSREIVLVLSGPSSPVGIPPELFFSLLGRRDGLPHSGQSRRKHERR